MHKRTQEEFIAEIKASTNDAFDVVGEYKANNIPVALRCHKCGNIIYKRPCKMTCACPEGCYICNKKNWHKTTETFKEELEAKYPGEYEVVGEYIKARAHIEVRHNRCGRAYDVTPDNLLRGKGCPFCSTHYSSYMKDVERVLQEAGVCFTREKYYDDCKYKRLLPFDYYLPLYNACIEVDGEYHYLPMCGQDALDLVQIRDEIKTEYCKEHNIPLLRLPYFEAENFRTLISSFIASLPQVNTEISA